MYVCVFVIYMVRARKKVGNIKDANARTKLSWRAFLARVLGLRSEGGGGAFRFGLRKVAIKKREVLALWVCGCVWVGGGVRLRAIEIAEMPLKSILL